MTLRIVFMGTPDFSVPSLEAIHRAGYNIAMVVTAPDRFAGRGRKLRPPPIKSKAQALGIPIMQPEDVNAPDALTALRRCAPDVVVVVSYGQILKSDCLAIPVHGCINLHPSLLPKYRGAAPIQYALLNGERVTGVTTIFMNERMDAGDIILQREVPIHEDDTAKTLAQRLAIEGAQLLVETLALIADGRAPRIPQDESQATYAPRISKDMARIDWRQSAVRIMNQVRAFNPQPGAYTTWHGRIVKIWMAHAVPVDSANQGAPGEIIKASDELVIATGDGWLKIDELQLESRQRMPAREWVRGARLHVGDRFDTINE